MTTQQIQAEGGLQQHRTEFLREETYAVPNTDPSFNRFSDIIQSIEWTPTPNVEGHRGIGDADPQRMTKGPEEHELSITYALQQFPVDPDGDPLDASGDGLKRDADNTLPNTHTIVDREEKEGTRIYLVALGGLIDEVTLSGDTESNEPITAEVTYQCQKIRSYQVDQPDSSTTLDIVSTDDNDTMDITIENDDASTSETLSLTGTTTVTTTESFGEIDAVWLASEPAGDITISDGSGTDFMTIYGSNSYDNVEGDRGIPPLGSGSHASALDTAYEYFLDDTIEWPQGEDLAAALNSLELSVSNNVDSTSRVGQLGPVLSVGNRETQVTATLFSPTASHDAIMQALRKAQNNLIWTLSDGELQVNNAAITDPGARSIERGQAIMTLDNTFTGEGLTLNNTS